MSSHVIGHRYSPGAFPAATLASKLGSDVCAADGAAAETVTVATVGGAAVSCVGGGEVGGLSGSG